MYQTRAMMFSGDMVNDIIDERKWQTRRLIRNICCREVENCPYGKVGDRLWVRERVRVIDVIYENGDLVRCKLRYEANGGTIWMAFPARLKPVKVGQCVPNGCFVEAARLFREIIAVRAERLHDITVNDIRAEGVRPDIDGPLDIIDACQEKFIKLWDSIYAKRGKGWDVNPWVWVIDFKVSDVIK